MEDHQEDDNLELIDEHISDVFNAILQSSKLRALSYTNPDDEFIQAEGYDRAFQLPTGQRDCVELRQLSKFKLIEAVQIMGLANNQVKIGTSQLDELGRRARSFLERIKVLQSSATHTSISDEIAVMSKKISSIFTEFDVLDYQIQWGGYDTNNFAYRAVKKQMKNAEPSDDDKVLWRQAKVLSKQLIGDLDVKYKAARDDARKSIDSADRAFQIAFGHLADEVDELNDQHCDQYSTDSADEQMVFVGEEDSIPASVRYRDAAAEAGSTRTRNTTRILDRYDENGRLILPKRRKVEVDRGLHELVSRKAKTSQRQNQRQRQGLESGDRNERGERGLFNSESDSPIYGTRTGEYDRSPKHACLREAIIDNCIQWTAAGSMSKSNKPSNSSGTNTASEMEPTDLDTVAEEWTNYSERTVHRAPRPITLLTVEPLQLITTFVDSIGGQTLPSILPVIHRRCNNSGNNSDQRDSKSKMQALDIVANKSLQLLVPALMEELAELQFGCCFKCVNDVEVYAGEVMQNLIFGLSLELQKIRDYSKALKVNKSHNSVVEVDASHDDILVCKLYPAERAIAVSVSLKTLGEHILWNNTSQAFEYEGRKFDLNGVLSCIMCATRGYFNSVLSPLISNCSWQGALIVPEILLSCYNIDRYLLGDCPSSKLDNSTNPVRDPTLSSCLNNLKTMYLLQEKNLTVVDSDYEDFVKSFVLLALYLEFRYQKLLVLGTAIENLQAYRKATMQQLKQLNVAAPSKDSSSNDKTNTNELETLLKLAEIMELACRLALEANWDELIEVAMAVDWLLLPSGLGLVSKISGSTFDEQQFGLFSASNEESNVGKVFGLPTHIYNCIQLYQSKMRPRFITTKDCFEFFGNICPFTKLTEMFLQLWSTSALVSVQIGNTNSPKLTSSTALTAVAPHCLVDMSEKPFDLINKKIVFMLGCLGIGAAVDAMNARRSHFECLVRLKNLSKATTAAQDAVHDDAACNMNKSIFSCCKVTHIDSNNGAARSGNNSTSTGTHEDNVDKREGDDNGMFFRIFAIIALQTYAMHICAHVLNSSSDSQHAICGQIAAITLQHPIRVNNWKFVEQISESALWIGSQEASSTEHASSRGLITEGIEWLSVVASFGHIWEFADVGLGIYLKLSSKLLTFIAELATNDKYFSIGEATNLARWDAWDDTKVIDGFMLEGSNPVSQDKVQQHDSNNRKLEEFAFLLCQYLQSNISGDIHNDNNCLNSEVPLSAMDIKTAFKLTACMMSATFAWDVDSAGGNAKSKGLRNGLLLVAEALSKCCSASARQEVLSFVFEVRRWRSQGSAKLLASNALVSILVHFSIFIQNAQERDPQLTNPLASNCIRATNLLFKKKSEGIERLINDSISVYSTNCNCNCTMHLFMSGAMMACLASVAGDAFGYTRVDPGFSVPAAALQRNCFEENTILRIILETTKFASEHAPPSTSLNAVAAADDDSNPTMIAAMVDMHQQQVSAVESALMWIASGCCMTSSFSILNSSNCNTNDLLRLSVANPALLSCLIGCISSENVRNQSKLSDWKAMAAVGVNRPMSSSISVLLLTALSFEVALLGLLREALVDALQSNNFGNHFEIFLEAFKVIWLETFATIAQCLDNAFLKLFVAKKSFIAPVGIQTMHYVSQLTLSMLPMCAVNSPSPHQQCFASMLQELVPLLLAPATSSTASSSRARVAVNGMIRDYVRILTATIKNIGVSFAASFNAPRADLNQLFGVVSKSLSEQTSNNSNSFVALDDELDFDDNLSNVVDVPFLLLVTVDILATCLHCGLRLLSLDQRFQQGTIQFSREAIATLESVVEGSQLSDSPLSSWLCCRYFGYLMNLVLPDGVAISTTLASTSPKLRLGDTTAVAGTCMRDIIGPNLCRIVSVWISTIASLGFPHSVSLYLSANRDIAIAIGFDWLHNSLLHSFIAKERIQSSISLKRDLEMFEELSEVFLSCQGPIVSATATSTFQNWCQLSFRSFCKCLCYKKSTVTLAASRFSLANLSITELFHRHIRYLSTCLFRVPIDSLRDEHDSAGTALSAAARKRDSTVLELTNLKNSFVSLLLILGSHPLSIASTEEARHIITNCLAVYFNSNELTKLENAACRIENSKSVSSSLTCWIHAIRALGSKGVAFASRDLEWISMLKSFVNLWSMAFTADIVNPRVDTDAETVTTTYNTFNSKAGIKAMLAWCMATELSFGSSQAAMGTLRAMLAESNTNRLFPAYNYLSISSGFVRDFCSSFRDFLTSDTLLDCDAESVTFCNKDAVTNYNKKLSEFRSYLLLSDTPWQLATGHSALGSSNRVLGSAVSPSLNANSSFSKKCLFARVCMSIYQSVVTSLFQTGGRLASENSAENGQLLVASPYLETVQNLGEEILFFASCSICSVHILRFLVGESATAVDANCSSSDAHLTTTGNIESRIILQRLLLLLWATHAHYFVNFKQRSEALESKSSEKWRGLKEYRSKSIKLLATTCKLMNIGVMKGKASDEGPPPDASVQYSVEIMEALQCCQLQVNSTPGCLDTVLGTELVMRASHFSSNSHAQCRKCLSCVGGAVFVELKAQVDSFNARLNLLNFDFANVCNERQTQISRFSAGVGNPKPKYSIRHICRAIIKIICNQCDV